MALSDQVNPTVLRLTDLLVNALTMMHEFAKRPGMLEGAFLRHLLEFSKGDDPDARWIRVWTLQVWAHLHEENDRLEDAVPLWDEARRILEPDDEQYYFTSSFQITAMVKCGRDAEALPLLVDAIEFGLANEMQRHHLLHLFCGFGRERLHNSVSNEALQGAAIAFMARFHDMNEAEAAELLENDPHRVIEIITTPSQDLET